MPSRLPTTPPRLMRVLAVAAALAQGGIAVTGSVVRVTGSGLGCPDWPTCFPGSLTPDTRFDVAPLHQWVEFGNRLLTGLITVVALACLVAALATRPRRRRLTVLAACMPAGVFRPGGDRRRHRADRAGLVDGLRALPGVHGVGLAGECSWCAPPVNWTARPCPPCPPPAGLCSLCAPPPWPRCSPRAPR